MEEDVVDLDNWRRGQISAPAPLTKDHVLTGFDCGKAPLTDWLRTKAIKSEGKSARTMVIADATGVIGYYCLATGGVHHDEKPLPKLKRNMPNPIPTMTLGRLAVDKNFQGAGIGSAILQDALQRVLRVHAEVGFRALIVHAIDDEAKAFYIRYGFQEFPMGTKTLFLPIETLTGSIF
jgi:GNAT superfamily N-acetyltransferase